MPIPKSLFQTLRQRAMYRCEYCHYPEILSSSPLSVDHLQPQSLGGGDNLDNLALACRRCNEIRYNFTILIEGLDSGESVEMIDDWWNSKRDAIEMLILKS